MKNYTKPSHYDMMKMEHLKRKIKVIWCRDEGIGFVPTEGILFDSYGALVKINDIGLRSLTAAVAGFDESDNVVVVFKKSLDFH